MLSLKTLDRLMSFLGWMSAMHTIPFKWDPKRRILIPRPRGRHLALNILLLAAISAHSTILITNLLVHLREIDLVTQFMYIQWIICYTVPLACAFCNLAQRTDLANVINHFLIQAQKVKRCPKPRNAIQGAINRLSFQANHLRLRMRRRCARL